MWSGSWSSGTATLPPDPRPPLASTSCVRSDPDRHTGLSGRGLQRLYGHELRDRVRTVRHGRGAAVPPAGAGLWTRRHRPDPGFAGFGRSDRHAGSRSPHRPATSVANVVQRVASGFGVAVMVTILANRITANLPPRAECPRQPAPESVATLPGRSEITPVGPGGKGISGHLLGHRRLLAPEFPAPSCCVGPCARMRSRRMP